MDSKLYGIGVFLTLVGGSGLAEISTSAHGSFVVCAIAFSIGVSLCVTEFFRKG